MKKLLLLILVFVLFKPLSVKSEEVAKLADSKLEITYHKSEWYLKNCDYQKKMGRPCKKWTFNLYKTSRYAGGKAYGYCRRNNSSQKCSWTQNGKSFEIVLHKEKGFGGAIHRSITGTISGSLVKGGIFSKSGGSFIGQIFPSGYLTLNTNIAKAEPSQRNVLYMCVVDEGEYYNLSLYIISLNKNHTLNCMHKFYINDDKEAYQILHKESEIWVNKPPGYKGTIKRNIFKSILENQIAKKPENSNNDQANLEEEKQKIEKEKKKIAEEKRKIAEAKKKQEEEEKQREEANAKLYIIGSGTGFFVSAEGHVVSNDHVVGICRQVASKIDGEIKYFNVIKTDEVNDLGIVKGEYKNSTYLSIKTDGAEYGEDIVAFGYPLRDDLSDSVKLTRGIVSSLSGPGNNYSEIQIDAAIQPGNSGGPVLNMDGQVVGVASSGLNKIAKLLDEDSPYIPENINFAVAAPTLSNFLKANGVKVDNKKFEINNTKELAKIGRPATLQLFCMNTKAVFEELKKTKKHADVLFEKVIDLR